MDTHTNRSKYERQESSEFHRQTVTSNDDLNTGSRLNTLDQLDSLIAARHKVAQLVLIDIVYAQIFARLEREIAALETERDLISRARALVANGAF